jgi:hypothetical protein
MDGVLPTLTADASVGGDPGGADGVRTRSGRLLPVSSTRQSRAEPAHAPDHAHHHVAAEKPVQVKVVLQKVADFLFDAAERPIGRSSRPDSSPAAHDAPPAAPDPAVAPLVNQNKHNKTKRPPDKGGPQEQPRKACGAPAEDKSEAQRQQKRQRKSVTWADAPAQAGGRAQTTAPGTTQPAGAPDLHHQAPGTLEQRVLQDHLLVLQAGALAGLAEAAERAGALEARASEVGRPLDPPAQPPARDRQARDQPPPHHDQHHQQRQQPAPQGALQQLAAAAERASEAQRAEGGNTDLLDTPEQPLPRDHLQPDQPPADHHQHHLQHQLPASQQAQQQGLAERTEPINRAALQPLDARTLNKANPAPAAIAEPLAASPREHTDAKNGKAENAVAAEKYLRGLGPPPPPPKPPLPPPPPPGKPPKPPRHASKARRPTEAPGAPPPISSGVGFELQRARRPQPVRRGGCSSESRRDGPGGGGVGSGASYTLIF